MAKEETKKKKTVKIRLPKDREHSEDLYVCLNGKTYLIQRGKEVEVPEAVAKIIDNSIAMDELALERREAAMKQF